MEIAFLYTKEHLNSNTPIDAPHNLDDAAVFKVMERF